MLGRIRRAIDDYNMIDAGDRIAIGLSGGKDSVALLYGLSRLKSFYPKSFSVTAITIDLGFDGFDTKMISDICNDIGIPFVVIKTQIGKIVFNERKEENPCSLCANMRRGALNNAAIQQGCNKVALAHNNDDILDTLLLSLIYEGRINTFSPVTELSRSGIIVIRPLIYMSSDGIRSFICNAGFNVVLNPCKVSEKTSRKDASEVINLLASRNPDIKSNIFGAIKRAKIGGFKY